MSFMCKLRYTSDDYPCYPCGLCEECLAGYSCEPVGERWGIYRDGEQIVVDIGGMETAWLFTDRQTCEDMARLLNFSRSLPNE